MRWWRRAEINTRAPLGHIKFWVGSATGVLDLLQTTVSKKCVKEFLECTNSRQAMGSIDQNTNMQNRRPWRLKIVTEVIEGKGNKDIRLFPYPRAPDHEEPRPLNGFKRVSRPVFSATSGFIDGCEDLQALLRGFKYQVLPQDGELRPSQPTSLVGHLPWLRNRQPLPQSHPLCLSFLALADAQLFRCQHLAGALQYPILGPKPGSNTARRCRH